MKIAVFGKPGGGKSTLSLQIAAATKLRLHQLDLVQYQRGGGKVPDEEFLRRHAEIMAQEQWVVDGFGNPQAFAAMLHAANVLVYVERLSLIHYWWIAKRLLKSPFSKPLGWPEGSPMLSSTISSYRFLRRSPRFWNSALKAELLALRPGKRVYVVRRQSDVGALLAELKSLDAMQPTAIVLHGPTSAGKTTLARALQAISPVPAFHISLDAFVTMSNRRDMRSDEERAKAYKLHCENLRSTVSRIAQTEFDIILDLVLRDEAELQACLKALNGRATYLIGVSAPLPVLEARERERPDRASGIAKEQVADPVYNRQYDLVLDTSRTSPEAGAATVRKLMNAGSRLTTA